MYNILVGVIAVLLVSIFFRVAIRSLTHLENASDFFISRDRLGTGGVFATLYAAEMSIATVFIAFFQLAPFLGYILIASIVTFGLGQFLLWVLIPRIKSSVPGAMTLAGFVGKRYNSIPIRRIVAVVSILGFVGLFVTEIVVGAKLISAVAGGSSTYWPSVAAIFSFVLFYTLMGGFRNVVNTDKIQVALVLIGILIILIMAISIGRDGPDGSLIDPALPKFSAIGLTFLISLFVINVLYPIVDMAAWQRISAAKSVNDARAGFGFGILSFAITWSVVLFAALALSENSSLDQVGGLASNFEQWAGRGLLETVLAAVGIAALMAALLSAGDIFLVVAAQSWSFDVSRAKHDEADTNAISISSARRSVFLMAVLGALLASAVIAIGFSVADMVFVFYGSTVALFPTVLYSLMSRKALLSNKFSAMASMLGGLIYGWVYGVFALLSSRGELYADVFKSINFIPGDPSAYNAPIAAVIGAVSVILLVMLAGLFSRTLRKQNSKA